MEHNSEFSMQDAMRLAQTPAGRQLLTMLQQQNSGELQKAIGFATAGDYQSAQALLSSMLDSPEAKKLLKQLGG